MTNNKLPEWRKTLNKCVENYQSTRAWYEENRDSPAALDDMERAEDQLANFVKKCGFSIVLGLLDEIDELQELRRSCLALRGEIEDVQEQLYEAENRNNADDEELQERRKADSEPAGYHVIKECGKVGCSVATLEEAEKTRDFWNKRWAIRPYFYTPPARDNKQTDELVMWVKRLAHSLRNARPNSKLHDAAMDYLSRKGLISVEDVLR
ncbi:hypothetical protein [Salmonella enterica]|uniref:hypothetical protein n=1 Tax=Salmonella enterica TaxID=28901 RepID=UPI0003BCFECC|nr:hypothetical protein [Salmonella enterica]ESJ22088.1 hypothetical protein SED60170_03763 [Salmonella enterica subsp. diarizonae serovar 60:r:e,n,x,z15 str. 01-0170]